MLKGCRLAAGRSSKRSEVVDRKVATFERWRRRWRWRRRRRVKCASPTSSSHVREREGNLELWSSGTTPVATSTRTPGYFWPKHGSRFEAAEALLCPAYICAPSYWPAWSSHNDKRPLQYLVRMAIIPTLPEHHLLHTATIAGLHHTVVLSVYHDISVKLRHDDVLRDGN